MLVVVVRVVLLAMRGDRVWCPTRSVGHSYRWVTLGRLYWDGGRLRVSTVLKHSQTVLTVFSRVEVVILT